VCPDENNAVPRRWPYSDWEHAAKIVYAANTRSLVGCSCQFVVVLPCCSRFSQCVNNHFDGYRRPRAHCSGAANGAQPLCKSGRKGYPLSQLSPCGVRRQVGAISQSKLGAPVCPYLEIAKLGGRFTLSFHFLDIYKCAEIIYKQVTNRNNIG